MYFHCELFSEVTIPSLARGISSNLRRCESLLTQTVGALNLATQPLETGRDND